MKTYIYINLVCNANAAAESLRNLQMWVRFPLGGMIKFKFFALVIRQGVGMSSATYLMSRKLNGNSGTECLDTEATNYDTLSELKIFKFIA